MDFRNSNEQDHQPLVTAIVLCYNQARFVIESLESVRNQTYKNIQLIIIDDASEDGSVDLIKRWIKEHTIICTFVPHEKNIGICKTLNEALSCTKGKYVALLASDDIWMPNKTQEQVTIMEKLDSSVGIIYSDALLIDEKGELLPQTYLQRCDEYPSGPEGDVFLRLTEKFFVLPTTMLVRKECYVTAGPYDERLAYEDWDMLLRIALHYQFTFSSFVSAKYRAMSKSFTQTVRTLLRDKFNATQILVYSKCFKTKKLDQRHKVLLGYRLAEHAKLIYEANYPKKNYYIKLAFQYNRSLFLFFMLIFSLAGVPYLFFSRTVILYQSMRSRLRDTKKKF